MYTGLRRIESPFISFILFYQMSVKTYRTEDVLLFIWCMSHLHMSTHGRFDVFLIGHIYHLLNASWRG